MVIVGSFGVMLPSPIVEKGETLRRNVYKECDISPNLYMYMTAHQQVIQNQPHGFSCYLVLQTCHCHCMVFTMELVNLLPEACLCRQCSIVVLDDLEGMRGQLQGCTICTIRLLRNFCRCTCSEGLEGIPLQYC